MCIPVRVYYILYCLYIHMYTIRDPNEALPVVHNMLGAWSLNVPVHSQIGRTGKRPCAYSKHHRCLSWSYQSYRKLMTSDWPAAGNLTKSSKSNSKGAGDMGALASKWCPWGNATEKLSYWHYWNLLNTIEYYWYYWLMASALQQFPSLPKGRGLEADF